MRILVHILFILFFGLCKTYALGILREYSLTLDHAIAAPDCVEKDVIQVNGQYPGPRISAYTGDTLRIRVCNNAKENVSMHWHGMHQKGSQWQDGPAHGTQCPIVKGQCLTYEFNVQNQHGTYWYHGHLGLLRTSVYGPLIIRTRKTHKLPFPKPHGERVVLLNDWYHRSNEEIEAGFFSKESFQFIESPRALLINGRTLNNCSFHICKDYAESCPGECNPNHALCNPPTRFTVVKGKTYRFRVVNVAIWAQVNFRIEGHNLTIVMADGHYIKPLVYDSITLQPGISFDVLVTFNKPTANYWMVSNGQYDTSDVFPPGLGVIRYKELCKPPCKNFIVPKTLPPNGPDTLIDTEFAPYQQMRFKRYKNVVSKLRTQKPNRYLRFRWNSNIVDGYNRFSINNVSFVKTETPLLYSEYYGFPGVFTNKTRMPTRPPFYKKGVIGLQPCKLGPSILSVNYGDYVQVVLQHARLQDNTVTSHHPWHLHGIDFYVVYYGKGQYSPKKEKEYSKSYNLVDPPLRSMVTVYEGTFVVIRFFTNNVGIWNMHCHMEPHMELGMQLFLRVKGKGGKRLPPPPENHPKCGRLMTWKPRCKGCKWSPSDATS